MNVCPALDELCRKGMTHLMDGERWNTRSLTKSFLQATRLSNRIVGPLARKYPAFITQMLTLFCQKNERLITYRYTAEFAVFGVAKSDNFAAPVHILKAKMTGFPRRSPVRARNMSRARAS